LDSFLVHLRARLWSDDCDDGLAKVGVRNPDYRALGNARNCLDRGFDLGGMCVVR
jgi:hypothetical protein